MPAEAAGLYVHVPFCSVVCPYCDFAVRTGRQRHRLRYRDALLAEIELRAAWSLAFDSIYLGGGTPSALEDSLLASIFEAIRERFDILPGGRVSMEVNPEDTDPARLAAWRRLGVGTISLGTQSFDDGALALLGRRHSGADARAAVQRTREAGFETVSVDLMFALPGRDEESWLRELDRAVALEPDHVSCYQLTFHEGTPFHRKRERGELVEPPNEDQARLFRLTHERLGEAGYEAYEVSNFARGPEHRSRHNLKYWRHVPYLGLGPSAHSFDGSKRWWNRRDFEDWDSALADGRLPVAGEETLTAADLALEALMLGLRTTDGVDLAHLTRLSGLDLRAGNTELIERLVREGLLVDRGDRLAPTLDGLCVADSLAPLFET